MHRVFYISSENFDGFEEAVTVVVDGTRFRKTVFEDRSRIRFAARIIIGRLHFSVEHAE